MFFLDYLFRLCKSPTHHEVRTAPFTARFAPQSCESDPRPIFILCGHARDMSMPFSPSPSAQSVRTVKPEGGSMSNMNRRTFVATSTSLLATGLSWMLERGAEGAMQDGTSHPMRTGTTMEGHHHKMEAEMQRCIQQCQDCHARCIELINHCLMVGGRHAAPTHIRLLMDCAQLCTVTADFMARDSAFHDRTCQLCAELCRSCADSCAEVAGDDQLVRECVDLCHRCAESCDRMTSHGTAS
jgi:hypothetical protein